jgi:hypothetical protein
MQKDNWTREEVHQGLIKLVEILTQMAITKKPITHPPPTTTLKDI